MRIIFYSEAVVGATAAGEPAIERRTDLRNWMRSRRCQAKAEDRMDQGRRLSGKRSRIGEYGVIRVCIHTYVCGCVCAR